MKNATDDYQTLVALRNNVIHGRVWAFATRPHKLINENNATYKDPLQPSEMLL